MAKVAMVLMVLWCSFPLGAHAKESGEMARPAINRDMNLDINLDKNWELYWHQLLEPADFRDKKIAYDKKQPFPFLWNTVEINGKKLSNKGFLTLRKVIHIPELLVGKTFGLRIPEMFSAYKLFVNGDVKATNGIVSDHIETYQPQWLPRTVTFSTEQKKIEFVLQVANFSYKFGGSWRNIEFGLAEKIRKKTHSAIFLDVFLFASVLTMGLYHLGLFLKRKKDHSALYFALLCFVVSLRTLVSGEMLIYSFFDPNWELLLKLNFVTVALMPPLFVNFQYFLYHRCSNKWIANLSLAIGISFTLIIICLPARIHSLYLDIYHFVGLLSGVYIVFVYLKTIIKKIEGAVISLLAFIVLFLAGLNDILAVNNIIGSEQLLPVGLIVFFIAQSLMLAQRYSSALKREEVLSRQLEDLNERLEEKVEERTSELQEAMSEIKQLSGLLPICANCKKIRDDKGYWSQIEEYLSRHSDAVFSHSICPECMDEMYPELKGKVHRA